MRSRQPVRQLLGPPPHSVRLSQAVWHSGGVTPLDDDTMLELLSTLTFSELEPPAPAPPLLPSFSSTTAMPPQAMSVAKPPKKMMKPCL